MKIYVFGAGASLGSQNNEYSQESEYRSPLMDELFAPRYRKLAVHYLLTNEELDEFMNEISRRDDKSVEMWLVDRWKRISSINSDAKKNSEIRLFGRIVFYIWNVLRVVSESYKSNNIYRLFLQNHLENVDEDCGIINFNYDTLLDKAYEQVYHTSFKGDISTYLDSNFIKPHGSINWILTKRRNDPDVPGIYDTHLRINMAMEEFFHGPILFNTHQILNPALEHLRGIDIAGTWERLSPNDYFYPMIFLPLADKDYSHIYGFSETVINRGREMMKTADEIYLIGCRAKDSILKDFFSNAPMDTQIHVISNRIEEADRISSDVLKTSHNLTRGSVFGGGFELFNKMHFNK